MLKGNDLILSLGGTRLAASKTCGVERQTDTIEKCSPISGAAREFIPSTTSWSIAAGGLYADFDGANRLREIWRQYQDGVSTPIAVSVRTSGKVEVGTAILTSLHEEGNLNELVKFSIQLQGSGKLSRLMKQVPLFDLENKFLPDVAILRDPKYGWGIKTGASSGLTLFVLKEGINYNVVNNGNGDQVVLVIEDTKISMDDILKMIKAEDMEQLMKEKNHAVLSGESYSISRPLVGGTFLIVNGENEEELDKNASLFEYE